ncbi:hypothetical protein [Arenibacter certesii]|uniref:Adhesin domain-containing protein n=1 Tax=Arenibacter certesii TaxID=228955 RepID=A0A918ML16_9FLAO|nr:hypothetical protein [Arenibacter certesii]GGW33173.1 hypothetical protein GCM10007383_17710 [Arenibacter certesii]
MKTVLHRPIIALLLAIPFLTFATDEIPDGKYTKEKTIKKEYTVNHDALLKVKNSYGNLNIISWNENGILIEVHVKTTGDNEEKVQRKLDDIAIDFESTNSMVAATTVFNQSKSNWNWSWGKNNNINMQVNYTIKVPVKNSVHLSNDYGSIILNRIDGHANISCDYGRLEIGELYGRNNQLSFDYTSRSTIGYMNSGTINADYSEFTIERAGNLTIVADYTNTKVESMEDLTYTSDYGKLEIGNLANVKGNGDYINVVLGSVHGNLHIKSNYGSIKIHEMASDAGNLQLRTTYTGIKLGYAPDYHFNFEIQTSYAGVSGKDDFTINVSNEKSSKTFYKGYYGSQNSEKSVVINSEYGGISFKKKE